MIYTYLALPAQRGMHEIGKLELKGENFFVFNTILILTGYNTNFTIKKTFNDLNYPTFDQSPVVFYKFCYFKFFMPYYKNPFKKVI